MKHGMAYIVVLIRKLIAVIIVLMVTLSLWNTLYEYDNYKRQYNTAEFRYEEGRYKDFYSAEETYIRESQSYNLMSDAFQFTLYWNLIIALLVVVHFLTKKILIRK